MAVDMTQKKQDWINAVIGAAMRTVNELHTYRGIAESYAGQAFNGGDPENRPDNRITDEDLATMAPWLDADSLNQFIGGMAILVQAYADNSGIIEAARP